MWEFWQFPLSCKTQKLIFNSQYKLLVQKKTSIALINDKWRNEFFIYYLIGIDFLNTHSDQ